MQPGEQVSVDQIVSAIPGFIAQTTGILATKRFTCATIFVDDASGFGFVWPQISTSVQDTLVGKEIFEQKARDAGIIIKSYRADNGTFKAKEFVKDCYKK